MVTSPFDKLKRRQSTEHTTCGLKIIVDYGFHKFYCGESRASTINAIVFAITTASSIFGAADFNFDGEVDNIGFTIKEIVLHESTSTQHYLMESQDAITVLNAFSHNDFSGYCMGVLLTYREFNDGVIGLTYRGSSHLRGYTGGICTGYSFASQMSLNTLIVSTNSYGAPLSTIMFALTLTHELGHSFGHGHDDMQDKECSPAGYRGNYIMYHIVSDSKPNNRKFSKCSLLQMGPVIFFKGYCFETVNEASICGNYMVDPGEECDCGPTPEKCHIVDPCCVPSGKDGCKVAIELGKRCSARVSACCATDCQVDTRPTRCSDDTECVEAAFCNGIDAECPEAVQRPDGTLCMDGMRLCSRGNCVVSRCKHHGWEECQCLVEAPELCQLCCRDVTEQESACMPAYRISLLDNLVEPVYQRVGDSCGNDAGYCNDEHVCITKYSSACKDTVEYVLKTTRNELFLDWLLNHWILLVLGLGVVLSFLSLLHNYSDIFESVSLMAYKSGKVIALWTLARWAHLTLDEQLQNLESSYRWKQANLCCHMDVIEGVAQLRCIFPTVPDAVLEDVVTISSYEEVAVRWLLLKGYPMKKCLLQLESNLR